MNKGDPTVSLHQRLAYASEAVEITRGKIRPDLDHDRLLNLALTRLLEMLGVMLNLLTPFTEEPWLEARFEAQYLECKERVARFIGHYKSDAAYQLAEADPAGWVNECGRWPASR